METLPTPLTFADCSTCGHPNQLDNRAPKCSHYCRTCASVERRLPHCKEHPAQGILVAAAPAQNKL